MTEREQTGVQFVKSIILGEDGIHIDLVDGLRLSGPLAVLAQPGPTRNRKRRMLVSGHEAVYAVRAVATA